MTWPGRGLATCFQVDTIFLPKLVMSDASATKYINESLTGNPSSGTGSLFPPFEDQANHRGPGRISQSHSARGMDGGSEAEPGGALKPPWPHHVSP